MASATEISRPYRSDHKRCVSAIISSETVYDGVGDAVAQVDPLGRRTTYAYDSTGHVESIRNPLEEETSYGRDPLNRITSVTNPLGFRTTYVYDDDGALEQVTNAENETTAYTYDADHHLESAADPLNHSTTYRYDSRGNQTAIANPLGETTTFVYDAASRRVASINPLLNRTTFAYDPAGNPIRVTNPELESTTSVYDAEDRVQASVDALLHRTTFTYNGASLQTSVENAEEETSFSRYDDLYRLTAAVDPLGNTTTSGVYDPRTDPARFVYEAELDFLLSGGAALVADDALKALKGSDRVKELSRRVDPRRYTVVPAVGTTGGFYLRRKPTFFSDLSDDRLIQRIRKTTKDADPTSDANLLRYERYRRGNGTMAYEEWFPASRGSRTGGPNHVAIQTRLKDSIANAETEKQFGDRWADVFEPMNTTSGTPVVHQIGDVNDVRLDPIARERLAIMDLVDELWNKATPDAPDAILKIKVSEFPPPGWITP